MIHKILAFATKFKYGTSYYGKSGAGLLFICLDDNTVLLLKRSDYVEQPGTYGIAGGALQDSEDNSLEAAKRETIEELGNLPTLTELVDTILFKDGDFTYTTYIYNISLTEKQRWTPTIQLNWENTDARWFPFDSIPGNLHFGVEFIKKTLQEKGYEFFHDPQDNLDWLRLELKVLRRKTNDKTIFEPIFNILSNVPKIWGADRVAPEVQSEFFLSIERELRNLLKFYLRNKDVESAAKIRELLTKNYMSRSHLIDDYNKRYRENEELNKLPLRERAQHSGLLYHGTTLADAVSILRNKTFTKASAFDRLSLTTDITSAMKFGDTIFVFDAKKLQRRGAKKMKYVSEEEQRRLHQQTGKWTNEDDRNRARIYELYRYEREWFMWLPFSFKDSDLVKMIFVKSSYKDMSQKAKIALETVTKAPVQIMSFPSYALHGLENTREEDIGTGDLKYNLYQAFGAADKFISTGRQLLEKYRKELKEKYPDYSEDSIQYMVKNSALYYVVNGIFRSTQQMTEKRSHLSLLDASSLEGHFQDIKYIYDRTDWNNYLLVDTPLKHLVEELLKQQEQIKKSFSETFLSNDTEYEQAMWKYSSSYLRPFRNQIRTWIEAHLDKFIKYVESLNLDPGNVFNMGEHAKYFIEETNKLAQLPDSVLRAFPGAVMDNKEFGLFNSSRINHIFVNNPYLQEYHFKYELERAEEPRKNNIQQVADIYYQEHPDKKGEAEKERQAEEKKRAAEEAELAAEQAAEEAKKAKQEA